MRRVNGVPTKDCFQYEKCNPGSLKKGQPDDVLIRSLFLSVDPALRCRMNESTGVAYLSPWVLGDTVMGLGGVGVVEESFCPDFHPGDFVGASMVWPWKLFFTSPHDQLVKIERIPPSYSPSIVVSCLGLIGLTVLVGIQEKGNILPEKNQTFVVSGAAGACGTLAGQIARLLGAKKVVGICGSAEKCGYLVDELRFDAAINYKEDKVTERLGEVCSNGIHVYFDNVGGEISDAVLKQMNPDSDVILCGQISQYNKDVPYPPPLSEEMNNLLKERNIHRERYLVLNYQDKFPDALKRLEGWLASGDIKVKESVEDGLENAGRAFVGMMNGENVGKQLVKVSSL